jgi:PH (Pleckstrin Homology) domain-containing protein
LYQGQQYRYVPDGKEVTPGKICVTDQRVILETTSMLGIKKDYEDLHYSDIMGIDLKKNVLSGDLVISRFQGEIHIKAIGKKDAPQLERIISQEVTEYGFGAAGNQARYQQDRMNDYRRDNGA